MKILFFGAKSYDIKSFDAYLDKEEYKDLDVVYIEPNLTPQTAMLAAGYEAVCAFVNMDLSAETIDILNTCKVKLILMRCAGFNNVDLERAKGYGMTVTRVPSYSPEAVAEHAMALALTANRHTHKAYIKVRENNYSLNGLMGVNFYKKTVNCTVKRCTLIIGNRNNSHFKSFYIHVFDFQHICVGQNRVVDF